MDKSEFQDRIEVIAERLKRAYHAQTVILYGSRATGQASEESDTDLFIIAPTDERFFERIATVLRLLRGLYTGLGLSPIVLTPDEVQQRLNRGDPFVKEILESGVSL